MNKLYLITGPAGVGKSTVSRMLADTLERSALIEGDDLYNMVRNGYISPWKEGNQLDLMWDNALYLINNFLKEGFDVIFNYIINEDKLKLLKETFRDYDIKFIVLLVDEETIIKRDKERPEDCRQNERCLILLNSFKNKNYDKKHVLDTSNLTIEETVNIILEDNRFNT